MDRSAIILSGGVSSRFGQDKGLLLLAGKPLIKYVLDATSNIVDEKIVVVSSESQAEAYKHALGQTINYVIDKTPVSNIQGPLLGALSGFQEASGKYALLLPCDTPLISREIVLLLFELCIDRNAVIPRWPNAYIEPLQAVYRTNAAYEAVKNAVDEGEANIRSMVDRLRAVRYVSTLVLQQLDPKLKTFFNVNTPMDLKKAEIMLKRSLNSARF